MKDYHHFATDCGKCKSSYVFKLIRYLFVSVAIVFSERYEIALKVGQHIEERSGFLHYIGRDEEAKEIKKALASKRVVEHGVGPFSGIGSGDDFVVVCGYGRIGKVVCEVSLALLQYEMR